MSRRSRTAVKPVAERPTASSAGEPQWEIIPRPPQPPSPRQRRLFWISAALVAVWIVVLILLAIYRGV